MPAGSARDGFCCAGCEAVYALLREQGLGRYYALAGSQIAPVAEPPKERSHAWLDPLLARAEATGGPIAALDLDVQGIHCAACVWLMNELYRREAGAGAITVNPALGKVSLRYHKGAFDVRRYLRAVEAFGYLFGPSRKSAGASAGDLPIRLGISAAITMNVMLFSVSFYFGLTPADGPVFALFTQLSAWLSLAVVIIGGWPFFRAAWQGLRRRVLHLDLPIALGIVLVFATSWLQARQGRGDLAYFDTLNTFVTLMLVGRWLQQRVVERNRRFLLEDDGAEGLFVRRVEGARLATVPAARIEQGDVLLVAPGDLVPVDASLLDERAAVTTDWITGEADVRHEACGARLPAGACNAGQSAIRVRAQTSFDASPLVTLLRKAPSAGPAFARFWNTLSRGWVAGVLAVAGFGVWLWWPEGPHRALDIAAALLVVTCPCAIGIAAPLAYELAQSRLRRHGVFVRSADLLDRLPRVKKVLFDKTGTLTLGRLELADRDSVRRLSPGLRDLCFELASRSNHPVSRCLHDALAREGARFTGEGTVVEEPGKGLSLSRDGATFRLGAAAWAAPGASGARGTVLARDGELLAAFALKESIRPDARRELDLLADGGHEVWLVSGDGPERVKRLAAELGVPEARALYALRPEEKAKAVFQLDRRDTLFVGDGVNDSLAFEQAYCAGTPAVDRPMMPGKSDFFLLGEGLHGVRAALETARELRRVVRRVLLLALAYNAVAIATSLAGLMSPLRAAIAMPASSLAVIGVVVWSLSRRKAAPPARAPAEAAPEVSPA